MVLISKYCNNHCYIKNGEKHVKLSQMMMLGGKECCPRCELNRINEKLEDEVQQQFNKDSNSKTYNIFKNHSILTDKTILGATFENYKTETLEERKNKKNCLQVLERLKKGEVFNVLLQGNPGAGKSHLAYSLLKALNESGAGVTCLFVNVEEMIRLIKDSFNNKQSKFTEQYFVKLLSEVDYLVLDDIGAETGAIETGKTATDFVQRILYAVTSARQDKVTISTTNLSSNILFTMYDKKLVSRLLKKPEFILFKETQDKRISGMPF
ncbi:ATP-binding protein [Bacillus sp. RG28]|uniref:ATP-binding protein n=2 Tax=Gottfriedia endophytica TaxID=2820819 RepID=A0A940NM35_9BACI|nr:ATP-binding protein [Gottfriedia endophytica]